MNTLLQQSATSAAANRQTGEWLAAHLKHLEAGAIEGDQLLRIVVAAMKTELVIDKLSHQQATEFLGRLLWYYREDEGFLLHEEFLFFRTASVMVKFMPVLESLGANWKYASILQVPLAHVRRIQELKREELEL